MITYPIIVRNFNKSDISYFKAFQSLIMILIAVIPLGTKQLFISAPKNLKEERWKVTFLITISVSLLLILIININNSWIMNILGTQYSFINSNILTLIILLASLKTLFITLLTSKIDFKTISIALIIKQLCFYSAVIVIAFCKKIPGILIYLVIMAEILEVVILALKIYSKRIRFLPKKKVNFFLDKVAVKYISFIGSEQIFNVLALHFPSIFVIFLMGSKLAPEFQLPFYAINIPASLIMMSVAKVLFPYNSEYRENSMMRKTYRTVIFALTFIMVPVLISIFILNKEIVSILFQPDWIYAMQAVRIFPIMIFVNVISNPFSTIPNIKEKPQIMFIYSLVLFALRMSALYFGYTIFGFIGAVVAFTIADAVVRLMKLKIDLQLIEYKILDFLNNIKLNLFAGGIYLISFFILKLVLPKYIALSASLLFCLVFIVLTQKQRIINLLHKVKMERK
ncbi:MAG: hypothetical protein PWQ09_753 [Candidatus Cloacimonadota bacterium]|nr:hypothetical protein [Candidatus Cloacimonadota bacterium]